MIIVEGSKDPVFGKKRLKARWLFLSLATLGLLLFVLVTPVFALYLFPDVVGGMFSAY